MTRIAFFLLPLFTLFFSSVLPAGEAAFRQPVKSPADKRDYGLFELSNGMRVLVVSDPAADRAAVSLAIGIGSSMEPDDRPGLAHFLEHMLFKGTKKYPGTEEYSQYISDHGGATNADTGADLTSFYFSVDPAHLEGALDRFAQFFIAPLFDAAFVDKERHAVDAEFRMKMKDDARRIHAALQQAYNPASPYSRFSVGNLETLADRPGDPVREDLVRFYQDHYSADIMGLAVLGREPLPELKAMVERHFSAVPRRNGRRYTPGKEELVFPPSLLPQQVVARPLGTQSVLTLIYPIPSPVRDYRTNPWDFVRSFFLDPAPGSLYATLHDRGWVGETAASWESFDRAQGQFTLSFGLTDEGLRHLGDLEKALYDYIELLKKEGNRPWRYAELQRMDELNFRYAVKESALEYVHLLAPRLLDYPARDLLRAGRMLMEYDADKIARALELLRPERATRLLVDRRALADRTAPYYDTPYRLFRPVPPLSSSMRFELRLPSPNPFIPERLELVRDDRPGSVPRKIVDQPGYQVWYDLDGDFQAPRAEFRARLQSPRALASPRQAVLQQLLAKTVAQQLLARGHQAGIAGLKFSVMPGREGLLLTLHGYDDKLPLLLEDVAAALRKPRVAAATFELHKRMLGQELMAGKQAYAYQQVLEQAMGALLKPHYSTDEQLDALESLKPADLEEYAAAYLEQLDVVLFLHGNLDEKRARHIASAFRKTLLAGTRLQPLETSELLLPPPGEAREIEYRVEHPDAVRVELFLDDATDPESQAHWILLAQLISQPFSTELRSRQQLGYLVLAQRLELWRHPGLEMAIQSSNSGAAELGRRMAAFREAFGKRLATLEEAQLQPLKKMLADGLQQRDQTLYQRGERYFQDILDRRTGFDFRQRTARALEAITPQSLRAFYRQKVLENPRMVVAWSPGRAGE